MRSQQSTNQTEQGGGASNESWESRQPRTGNGVVERPTRLGEQRQTHRKAGRRKSKTFT